MTGVSKGYGVFGDREYFPCGCFFVIDPKTGRTLQPWPCSKHKPAKEAGAEAPSAGPAHHELENGKKELSPRLRRA